MQAEEDQEQSVATPTKVESVMAPEFPQDAVVSDSPQLQQPVQPAAMQPMMMMPGQPQTVVIENTHIDTKIEVKKAFWNRREVVVKSRCLVMTCGFILIACCVAVSILTNMANEHAKINAQGMLQIVDSWSTSPFTELYIVTPNLSPSRQLQTSNLNYDYNIKRPLVEHNKCKLFDEPVFKKYMAGSEAKCYSNPSDDYNECFRWAYGFQGVQQSLLDGEMQVCGRKSNFNFVNAIRPDNKTGLCPAGTRKCSNNTNVENTICSSDTNMCPITQTQFIPASQISTFRQNPAYQISNRTYKGNYIVTSKVIGDNLPQNDFKMSYKMCAQKDIRASFPGECFYRYEYERTTDCVADPQTDKVYDDRYSNLNMTVSELTLQTLSGVMHALLDQPSYESECPDWRTEKANFQNNFFARPILPWKLGCEANGLDRTLVHKVLSEVDFSTDALYVMFYTAMVVTVCQACVLFFSFCSFEDKMEFVEKGKRHENVLFIGGLTVAQFIGMIVFFVAYTITDNTYTRIYASSAQLSDFNSCGDDYMFVDTDMLFAKLQQSQSHLNTAIKICVICAVAFFVQFFGVILRILRLTRPENI